MFGGVNKQCASENISYSSTRFFFRFKPFPIQLLCRITGMVLLSGSLFLLLFL
jgi:hypothetical protein